MSRKVVERNIAFDDEKNKYYVTLDYGKDKDGKRIKKSKTFSKKSEAKRCLREFEADKLKNELIFPNELTLGGYADYWIENIKSISCEETTLYGYKKIIENHIKPNLGSIALQKLAVSDLNKYFSKLKKEGTLGNSTIRKHQDLLKSILKSAVCEEKICSNPMDRVERIKVEQNEVDVYNTEQVKVLFNKVEGHPLELPVKLAGYLGLRRGEINGLKWKNVDLVKKQVFVRDTRTSAGKKEIRKGVKTQKSKRYLRISDELVELLEFIRRQQKRNEELFGEEYVKSEYVFTKQNGSLYRANYCSSEFKRFLEKNSLPRIKFHALRHSFASVANELGIPLFEVSRALGHSDTHITSKIYTHQFNKTNAATTNAVANAFR